MATWSQSHFLQSLGWATLNSFWQMALLWCLFLGASHLFKLSAHRKYQFSVFAITTGFAWFVFTFIYYNSNPVSGIAFFDKTIRESSNYLNILLIASSLAYLSLLIFPSYKLYQNWKFVQRIQKHGLTKADFNYRLFVQKISSHLGITKKVSVFASRLVRSPLTVGYFKPIILLPVAALNNLTTQQVEAILLHELSHIRRYDYLVNFMISIINTILYFNPFVKMFMRTMEEERENCCDQLVLQYGYDKVSYATALLTLEKLSIHRQALALGAAGKNFLMSRIEKIVGMEKKKGFRKNQLGGMLAALICIVTFNSVLIIKETKKHNTDLLAFSSVSSPFSLYENERSLFKASPDQEFVTEKTEAIASVTSDQKKRAGNIFSGIDKEPEVPFTVQKLDNNSHFFSFVALDDIDASLSKQEKEEVKATVENTRKVISGLQWNEIEKSIADVLSEQEKVKAKQEYLIELEKTVDFKKLEQNLKAQYDEMNLDRINSNLDMALNFIQLDSIQKSYQAILVQLEKANELVCAQSEVAANPLPDHSVEELRRSTEELRRKIETIKEIRNPRRVIRL